MSTAVKEAAKKASTKNMQTNKKEKAKQTMFLEELIKNRALFLMITPAVIFFILFNYIPMVGIYLAFTKFNFNKGILGSPFVGFDNFKFLFSSGTLLLLTKNTVLYNLAFIIIGNLMQVLCAITLSEVAGTLFKKVVQSIYFFPFFISMVLVGAFAYQMFNIDNGAINSFIKSFGGKAFNFYGEPSVWKYIIVSFNVWKGLGYGTVVYLAAIMSIDGELYEAAELDGANVFKQIRYITMPLLKPTFVLLIIFSLGGILKGQFDLFYQLIGNNGVLYNATDIIDTYVYRTLTVNFDMGMGSAAGLFQSSFGFMLVMLVNFVVKKIQPDYALF